MLIVDDLREFLEISNFYVFDFSGFTGISNFAENCGRSLWFMRLVAGAGDAA